ncbi:AAA family ATPase [Mediterraneibacter gnavus]|jgi:exodeoxyribonuclease V alpha subunit|uniref:AAA family ATPase n=1 Tax=Mediterraneibacter gnavus TaxID=33038 RepID=UPI0019245D43|nr:AAA family ATPase [Mediterraneibacter gnavus]
MDKKEVKFKCSVVRKTYDGGDYKIYAVDVDKNKYPDIKFTKYGNVTLTGEMHELGVGSNYEVAAVEQLSKYGYGYKVTNIKRDRPTNAEETYVFLREILTENQADVLCKVYPDIVDRVINNRLDDIDLNKTPGIKEYTFDVIKNKIVENFCLAEIVTEFQGMLTLSMVKKLHEKYSSVQMIKQKMREDPYKCLCGLARVGFKTADSILLELERESLESIKNGKKPIIEFNCDLKTSKQRCLSCVLYLLEENENNGHTVMDIVDLRNQCMKLTPACSDLFVDCIKHESIIYDRDTMNVALKSTYDTEQCIANAIIEGLRQNTKWNFNIEKYRTVNNGCELSTEQIKILDYICKYNICILNGSGGTGKTFSTQSVIQMLKDNNKSYELFSPTGKAAKVLSENTGEQASTIHRGLGYMPPDKWGYNEAEKMMCDVLIVDEFSMVDLRLFKHIIDAIDFKRTKLLMIGDNAQLPSVSCGNLLHDFMQSKMIPTVTLTKVFRYGEGGLMKVATDVRQCKQYLNNINQQCTYFGDNKDYAFINVGSSTIVKNLIALYQKLLSSGKYNVDDIQVLTSYKKGDYGQIVINNQLQKIANKNYGSQDFMKVGDITYYKDDIIIQNTNNYHARIFYEDDFIPDDMPKETFIANGETGKIKKIDQNKVIIEFDDVLVEYDRSAMQMCGLGYCITIHKSQGSSIKVVLLITPAAHTYMLNSNLIYVGLTRMKERCFHFGDTTTVNRAIKKKANLSRNTFMQKLLKSKAKGE